MSSDNFDPDTNYDWIDFFDKEEDFTIEPFKINDEFENKILLNSKIPDKVTFSNLGTSQFLKPYSKNENNENKDKDKNKNNLDDDEYKKKLIRREKNRIAAKKSRERRSIWMKNFTENAILMKEKIIYLKNKLFLHDMILNELLEFIEIIIVEKYESIKQNQIFDVQINYHEIQRFILLYNVISELEKMKESVLNNESNIFDDFNLKVDDQKLDDFKKRLSLFLYLMKE